MMSQPADCTSGRKTCSNVGSLDPDKMSYCPGCYDHIQNTVVIPFQEFKDAMQRKIAPPPRDGEDNDNDRNSEPAALDGTVYGAAMVYSAKLKCEKCKEHIPAGSLVIGTPGTKTVQRAYDPGTYVWKGPVSVMKLRHPNCVPLTKQMVLQLKKMYEENETEVVTAFRGGTYLSPSVKLELQSWVRYVTSDEAETQRKAKRRAATESAKSNKARKGNFKPKGPPASWREMAAEDPPDKLMEKTAAALKNFLKTYTYEKIPKSSVTKKKLVEMIVSLFASENTLES